MKLNNNEESKNQPKHGKVYVIGGSYGYARWTDAEIVDDFNSADWVMGTGGADIDPKMYRHPKHESTWSSPWQDEYELKYLKMAVEAGKPLWGTCRFHQMMGAMSPGGFLIQNLNHPYCHNIVTIDGRKFSTNSLHHQAVCTHDMNPADFELLAWAENISHYHETGYGNIEMKDGKEPEIIVFKNLLGKGGFGIGAQMHPEGLDRNSPTVKYCRELLENLLLPKSKFAETLVA